MSPRWLHWPAAAAGITLVIHDTFTDTANANADGRSPDTVDASSGTNTWTAHNGETYKISGTGKGVHASNDGSDFSKAFTIDGSSNPQKLSALLKSAVWSTANARVGPIFYLSNATDGSETFAKIDVNANDLRLVEYSAGSATSTVIASSIGLSNGSSYWIDVELSGATVDVTVQDSGRTTTLATGSTTTSLSATSVVGLNLVQADANYLCDEFLVYT